MTLGTLAAAVAVDSLAANTLEVGLSLASDLTPARFRASYACRSIVVRPGCHEQQRSLIFEHTGFTSLRLWEGFLRTLSGRLEPLRLREEVLRTLPGRFGNTGFNSLRLREEDLRTLPRRLENFTPPKWDHALRVGPILRGDAAQFGHHPSKSHFKTLRLNISVGFHFDGRMFRPTKRLSGLAEFYFVERLFGACIAAVDTLGLSSSTSEVANFTPFVPGPNDDDIDFTGQDDSAHSGDDYANDDGDDLEQPKPAHTPQLTLIPRSRRIVTTRTPFDSRVGKLAPQLCEVVRLAIDDDLMSALLSIVVQVAAACGLIAVKGPRFVLRLNCLVDFDSDECMFGLCSMAEITLGHPIIRPWWMASDMPEYAQSRLTCTPTPSVHVSGYAADVCSSGPGGTASDAVEEPPLLRLNCLVDFDVGGCMFGLCSMAKFTLGNPIMPELAQIRLTCTPTPSVHVSGFAVDVCSLGPGGTASELSVASINYAVDF
jgi:hypothetical protein